MALLCSIFLLYDYGEQVLQMNAEEWGLAAIFPLLALGYYGTLQFGGKHFNLRNLGLLKPFIIGFIWAGVVTIYPLLFQALETGQHYALDMMGWLFFLKNFVFISILCILFDIKDYAADHNAALKTFVVRFGLRKTLFWVILPMAIVGFAAFLRFTIYRELGWERILINSIPFVLLIIVSWSMQRRKSILYYLAIIDGLMLVKAACGIIGMYFLN
jgi:4-hydroxybenzoate polyprenyltransferase